jgi:integrase
MPARFDLTWDGSARRWRVQHLGQRFLVSCRQLVRRGFLNPGVPHTRRDTYRAANAWWAWKQGQLGGRAADVRTGTLSDHLRDWLTLQDDRARSGSISAGEARNRRYYAAHLESWVAGIELVQERAWADLHRLLAARVADGSMSPEYATKILGAARRFVQYLDLMGVCDRPRNLGDRSFSFRVPRGEVVTLAVADVGRILAASRDQSTLHYLLMLNCGFTQGDVSDLAQDEVDWQAGRITRRRSKTRHHDEVPLVTYTLWPETLERLERWRSRDPSRVLLRPSGTPWVGGEGGRSDLIRDRWDRLSKRLGIAASPKALRKTGATAIASHPEHGRYDWLYLGHSPATIKDRHYVRPDQEAFDRAVTWLRDFLGVESCLRGDTGV